MCEGILIVLSFIDGRLGEWLFGVGDSSAEASAAVACGQWTLDQDITLYQDYNLRNPCPQNWLQMLWDFR